jgi:hypothetical protein
MANKYTKKNPKFVQKKYTHKKMFNILRHQINANQNYIEIPSHPSRMTIIKKTTNAWIWMQEEKEHLFTAGRSVT